MSCMDPVDEFTLAEPTNRPNWRGIDSQQSLWRPLAELNTFSLKVTLEGVPIGGPQLKRS